MYRATVAECGPSAPVPPPPSPSLHLLLGLHSTPVASQEEHSLLLLPSRREKGGEGGENQVSSLLLGAAFAD